VGSMTQRKTQQATTEVTLGPQARIPEKLYFRIGEVALLVGVQAHVLRYWEREVTTIRPGKTSSNQRRYRRRDVESFREIKRLLYDERYTLAGAKKRLAEMAGEVEEPAPAPQVMEVVPAPKAAEPEPEVVATLKNLLVNVDPIRLGRARVLAFELVALAEAPHLVFADPASKSAPR
jgi:DNA-binding transcriptional MerR regulator